ncbi:MAG: TRAP transporter TatT component family protein, partial [Planctomycetota bacterium]
MSVGARRISFLLAAALSSLLACGCVSRPVRDALALARETDLDAAAVQLPATLSALERELAGRPRSRVLLEVLARGHIAYAFGFVEPLPWEAAAARRARAHASYRRARGYGLRLLALERPGLARSLGEGTAAPHDLGGAGRRALPGLYWTAKAWVGALGTQDPGPHLVAQALQVRAMLRRCAELDGGYDHGGPELLLGLLEASTPPPLGGRFDVARRHCRRAVELSGGMYLLTRTLFATEVLLRAGDRPAFERTLRDVLAADPDQVRSLALSNRIARRRAERYLARHGAASVPEAIGQCRSDGTRGGDS